jgi:hypothetical protein
LTGTVALIKALAAGLGRRWVAPLDRFLFMLWVPSPAEADLGKPVRFEVSALNVTDGWAFLMAQMREPDGCRIDYAGTPYEDEATAGRSWVPGPRGRRATDATLSGRPHVGASWTYDTGPPA